MVKLFSLSIFYKHPSAAQLLKSSSDLTSFGFFQRNSVQEFMTFTSKIITERTPVATRQSVKESEYMCHVYVRADNLSGVCISDHEYPHRVAHTLLTKLLDDFTERVPQATWSTSTEATTNFNEIHTMLNRYQNPKEADAMTKIQTDLDDTKIILHNAIEAVLERGEKIDDLVKKSEDLSTQSKVFYTTARKTNSCCNW